MGMKSKRKGNDGERELLQLLQDRGIEAQRNDQHYVGGRCNPDVGAQIGNREFHFEVKRTEKFRLYESLSQAQRDAEVEHVPVVAHRSNRRPWVVVLTLEDFLQLVGVEPAYSDPTEQESEELDSVMEEWSQDAEKMLESFDINSFDFDAFTTFATP